MAMKELDFNPTGNPTGLDKLEMMVKTINMMMDMTRDSSRAIVNLQSAVKDLKNTEIIDPDQRYNLQVYVREQVNYVIKENKLETSKTNKGLIYPDIWREVKRKYRIPSYSWLKKDDYRDCKLFISQYTVSPELLSRLAKDGTA